MSGWGYDQGNPNPYNMPEMPYGNLGSDPVRQTRGYSESKRNIIPEKATQLGWCFIPSWEKRFDHLSFSPTIKGAMQHASGEFPCYVLCRVMQTPRGRFILWARDAEWVLVNFLQGFQTSNHWGPVLGLLANTLIKMKKEWAVDSTAQLIKTLEAIWKPTVIETEELQQYFGLSPEDIL